MIRRDTMREEFEKVQAVLAATPAVDVRRAIESDEFLQRQQRVWHALQGAGFDAGFVFSDEHYRGDVPYLGGNTNITIEQVAGVIGRNGFHIIAGLEGGYTVEQLAPRAHAPVHKVEMLQLAGEDYPIEAERLEDIFEAACGMAPRRIALLTPREVVPVMLVEALRERFGPESVIDAQPILYRIKYEKSEAELALTRDAAIIGDAMLRTMLAVLKPGMLETQVAAWGDWVALELGAEELGFTTMVTANTANRTLIGKALNRRISPGDMVHLGVGPQRDGLTACIRRSVVALEPGQTMPSGHSYWLELIADAYQAGEDQFYATVRDNLPAGTIEKAVLDFMAGKSDEASRRIGKAVNLPEQKPYSCVHNAGYTECQEFYGAITLSSGEPLGERIVNMLDVALRGCGNRWDEVVIPGLDYVVVENTFGKSGRLLERYNQLPANCQSLVGHGLS
ncbi:MAG: M24 family metallopeptidase [Anaerolineae bacterium]